jgi:hypothetical protein
MHTESGAQKATAEELPAGTPVLSGPAIEHPPANRTGKPAAVGIDLIKKE